MFKERALSRLRLWAPRDFMELAQWLIDAENSFVVRNVLCNMGENFLAEPHEREVASRVRAVAVKLAAGDESSIARATHRMRSYERIPFCQLGLHAARAAALATAWNQARGHCGATDAILAERLREEFDTVLETFCKLLEPWDTAP